MVLSRWSRIEVEQDSQDPHSQSEAQHELSLIWNLALPPVLVTQTQLQALSKGAGGAGAEGTQGTHENYYPSGTNLHTHPNLDSGSPVFDSTSLTSFLPPESENKLLPDIMKKA